MPRVLHLIDATNPQELRLSLAPLLDRDVARPAPLNTDCWSQFIIALAARRQQFSFAEHHFVQRLPRRFGLHFLSGPALRGHLVKYQIDLIHSWSVDAAYTAALAIDDSTPLLTSLWDPAISTTQARQLLAINRLTRIGVLCHSGIVERRLVEAGVARERLAIVRPGVDFSIINQLKRENALKEELRIEAHHKVILLSDPPSKNGGHLTGLWAGEAARRLRPELLFLLPGISHEQTRIRRYLNSVSSEVDVRVTGDRYSFEQLLGIADVLLLPATADIPTTSIAWAMASGVPVLACANYSVTEFIADGQNGHLVKPGETMKLAGKIVEVIRDKSKYAELYDHARAQAFESFGLSRYVDQVQQAYENILAHRQVSKDMVDAAMDA